MRRIYPNAGTRSQGYTYCFERSEDQRDVWNCSTSTELRLSFSGSIVKTIHEVSALFCYRLYLLLYLKWSKRIWTLDQPIRSIVLHKVLPKEFCEISACENQISSAQKLFSVLSLQLAADCPEVMERSGVRPSDWHL